MSHIRSCVHLVPEFFNFFPSAAPLVMTSLADIRNRFTIYEDPNRSVEDGGRLWIHNSYEPQAWTRDPIAIQLLRAIQACKGPQPPPYPPPSRLQKTSKGPRIPRTPAPALCSHCSSMPNGMPWECQQSIGRDLFEGNYVTPTWGILQSWSQRLFGNFGLPTPRGFEQAILQKQDLKWAEMECHNSRYMGIVSTCSHCDKICRISWMASSTNYHMSVQRALLLSWLGLPYSPPAQPDPVPVV